MTEGEDPQTQIHLEESHSALCRTSSIQTQTPVISGTRDGQSIKSLGTAVPIFAVLTSPTEAHSGTSHAWCGIEPAQRAHFSPGSRRFSLCWANFEREFCPHIIWNKVKRTSQRWKPTIVGWFWPTEAGLSTMSWCGRVRSIRPKQEHSIYNWVNLLWLTIQIGGFCDKYYCTASMAFIGKFQALWLTILGPFLTWKKCRFALNYVLLCAVAGVWRVTDITNNGHAKSRQLCSFLQ